MRNIPIWQKIPHYYVSLLLTSALMIVMAKIFLRVGTKHEITQRPSVTTLLYLFAKAVILANLALFVSNAVLSYFNMPLESQAAILELENIDNIPEFICATIEAIICAPISEELLFRGILYRTLKTRTNLVMSILTTSFIFAALHFNILSFFPLFVFSVCLIQIYEVSGSIKYPIIVHSIFNLMTVIVILFEKIY